MIPKHERRSGFLGLLELRIGNRRAVPAWVLHLWLVALPLLFLPNLGFEIWTPFGVVELADLLMPGYLALVWIGSAGQRLKLLSLPAVRASAAFAAWALLGLLLFPLHARFAADDEIVFSALKIAKFLFYSAAGYLTAAAWATRRAAAFRWSLMGAALVTALGILLVGDGLDRGYEAGEAMLGYKVANSTSVLLAMLFLYLAAGRPSRGRLAGVIWFAALGVIVTGWLCSHGRGGWIAGGCGLAYLAFFGRRTVRLVLFVLAVAFSVYNFSPDVQEDFSKTFVDGAGYGRRVGPIDDGNRLEIWTSEGAKFWDAPVIGQGFFHREGSSSLNRWGSHNFWLQMALETGSIGAAILTIWVFQLWAAGRRVVSRPDRLGGRAGLIAGFVGSLSGEYLYGGTTLFVFFLVLTPTLGRALEELGAAEVAPEVVT